MSNRVTITLHIDLPDGVVPVVDYATVPPVGTGHTMSQGEWKPDEPPQMELPPFPDDAVIGGAWPAGKCPKHERTWTSGNYGMYCTAKDEQGNARGYCALKPGMSWNGRRIP